MSCFTVRVAAPSDGDSVSALLETSYTTLMARDYSADVLTLALPLICTANPMLLESGTYYVAESDDGRLIGCGGWTAERPGESDALAGLGHIRHFATHPGWTRRGVGRSLVERCKDEARKAAFSRLECFSSLNARGFYAAQGFQACGSITIQLSDECLFPSVRMECSL